MTNNQIWDIVIEQKVDLVRKNVIVCELGIAKSIILRKIISPLSAKLSGKSPPQKYELTREDYIFTFEIFSYLIFCDTESNQVFSFYNNLLQVGSVRSILQATVSNLKSKEIKEETKANLREIYVTLDEMVDLKSGNIQRALSDTETTKILENSDNVFFTRSTDDKMGKINISSVTYIVIILFRWSTS